MRFGGLYFLSGAMFATAAIKTTPNESGFGLLFVAAMIMALSGAIFEADNK